jgi:hypothetical protein
MGTAAPKDRRTASSSTSVSVPSDYLRGPRGWTPKDDHTRRLLDEADARRTEGERKPTVRIEGKAVPCIVCAEPAEPSLVSTPTCSDLCAAIVSAWMLPDLHRWLGTRVEADLALLEHPSPDLAGVRPNLDAARQYLTRTLPEGECVEIADEATLDRAASVVARTVRRG